VENDISNEELLAQEQAAEEALKASVETKLMVESSMRKIAEQVTAKFNERKTRRQNKENQWLQARALYLGSIANQSYAQQETPFKTSTSSDTSPKFNIVGTRCDTAISVLWAKQFAGGDKNWDIEPSRDPKDADGNPLDPAQVEAAADAMEFVIEDQLSRGKYGYQCRLAIEEMVVEGTAVLKTPVNSKHAITKYSKEVVDGRVLSLPIISTDAYPCVKRVPLWYFFPDDTALTIDAASDAIVLHPMSKEDLRKLKSDDTFFADAIDEALAHVPTEEKGESFYNFTNITDGSSQALRDKYKVLEYHGPMSRDELDLFNLTPTYETPNNIYFVEIWVVNDKVIRIQHSNVEGIQQVPFALCTWKADPSSMFGIGLATQLADAQKVINKTYEMILDNAAIAAGPQVVIDKTKITPADKNWTLRPFKLWYNNEFDADVTKAFYEFQPSNVTAPLMNLLQAVQAFAQEEAAVPFFMPGTQSAITQDTAYGTKELVDQSTTVIDYYNERWDDCVTSKVIEGFYKWNMQYNPDPAIKGDFEVDVRSSSDIRSARMHLADMEKMAALAGQDEELGILINKQALSKVRLMAMRIPHKGIIRTDEEVQAEMEARANAGPDPQMLELQLKQQELEVKKEELALKREELQLRVEQEMRQAQMDYEEKLGANAARMRESEAQVIAKNLEYQIELAKLAQADELNRAKIYADMQKVGEQESTKKFLAGMKATTDFQKIAIQKEELKYARKEGKGI
jgi:hypothetical protein